LLCFLNVTRALNSGLCTCCSFRQKLCPTACSPPGGIPLLPTMLSPSSPSVLWACILVPLFHSVPWGFCFLTTSVSLRALSPECASDKWMNE
jgi:hypothetical protein